MSINRGPRKVSNPNQRVLLRHSFDVVPGKDMPKAGDYVTLKNRTDGRTVGARFISHEYLDKCIVMPAERIDVSEDWVIV